MRCYAAQRAAALADMAEGLRLTAQALKSDDDEVADRAMSHLRTLRDGLSELGRTRTASSRVARRSAVWRSQIAPVVRETEDAGRLDLLGGNCLTLTRTAMATRVVGGRSSPRSSHCEPPPPTSWSSPEWTPRRPTPTGQRANGSMTPQRHPEYVDLVDPGLRGRFSSAS